MQLIFEQIRCGGDRNFGYLIGDPQAKVAAFVDPSYHPELFVERAAQQGLQTTLIFNTHGHLDHTNGNTKAKELTGAKIAAYQGGDLSLEDNQELSLGALSLKIFHTPGHCHDHIVIFVPQYSLLLTGDHLFVGKIGGTMDSQSSKKQYDSLHRLLNTLPEHSTVWPGHDYGCRPSSTLALEKATNPFLLASDFPSFLEMKRNWSTYKQQHGLK